MYQMQTDTTFDALHDILPGKHFYQFYKSIDDVVHVVVPYLRAGLEKDEACLWLVSERIGLGHARQVVESMAEEFSDFVASNRLAVMSAEDWYLKDGRFNEEQAIRNAMQYFDHVQQLGCRGLRAAGDIGGAVPREDWDKCIAYEEKVGVWIGAQAVTALCSYPILECTPSQTKDVLTCHHDVLMGQIS
jgi:hypothetical protein